MTNVTTETAPDRVERRSIVIDAPPSVIFELLADPAKHHTFDGSGTVRESSDENPDRLSMGSKFGMKMKWFVPYKMTNEVVDFAENELIGWRHMGGHVWRYTLEPVEGGTKVTEEFDWRPSRAPALLKLMKAPEQNAEAIEKTLVRLRETVV